MKQFKKIIFVSLIFFSSICKATITANYAPKSISLGENIELTLTIDNAIKTGSPNLTPLLKDFAIVSTGRSYSFADINGKTSSEVKWTIVLKPKHAGKLVIPGLVIGNDQSQSLTIDVGSSKIDSPQISDNNNSTYTILKTKLNEMHPYINQQIIYTVKLYNRQQLFDGQYKAPEVENALIVPLGEGKSYQTTLKGENYNVEELTYAIFPQKTGKITIIPPEFAAEVVDGFSPTKIHLIAKPININVRPLSLGKNIEDWLAAEDVILNEEYDNPKSTYTAGDTIVRNITLKASGMVGQLLPKLVFLSNDNYNVYANKPHIENTIKDGKIIATATYKVTYLLTKADNTEIPGIKIAWYNITSKKDLFASLPAKSINVTPNTRNVAKSIAREIKVNVVEPKKSRNILLPGIGLSLILLILFGIMKFKNKKPIKINVNSGLHIIQKACKDNDPIAAREALLAFAKHEWPDLKILNLNNIPIDNQEFIKELEKLTAVLYGKSQNNSWDGANLWQIISKIRINKTIHKTKKTLPPIYLH